MSTAPDGAIVSLYIDLAARVAEGDIIQTGTGRRYHVLEVGETLAEVLYRFQEMVALGCEPYPMVFDRERKDLRAFARWAIRGLYRAIPFEKYDVSIKRKRLPVAS